jgi:hypothetical protein
MLKTVTAHFFGRGGSPALTIGSAFAQRRKYFEINRAGLIQVSSYFRQSGNDLD